MTVDIRPPAGFSARAATLDDVGVITDLMVESAQAAIEDDDVTADEVRDGLARAFVDLARDTVLAFEPGGRLVGYGEAIDEHPERALVDVYLSPSLPDEDLHRLGVWLAGRCLDRAEEFVVASGRSGIPVGAGCYREEGRLAAVLQDAGMPVVRTFWRMSLDLEDSHLTPPVLPDGVAIQRLDVDTDADARLAHRLNTEAFHDHWGDVDYTFDRFWEDRRGSSAFDPTQWWVAEVDGAAAGLLFGDNRRDFDNAGWVRSLGVLPQYRGRGVGKALLRHAFAEYRRRGRARAMLAVDSENQTGATRLYESVGMAPVLVTDAYQLTLPR